jgi:hypothetical protein
MAELDVAAKVLLRQEAEAFLSFAFGRKVRSVAPDETEFQAVEVRLDRLFRVVFEGDSDPTWVNVEVEAAWKADVPEGAFDHWSFIFRDAERRPLRSLVIVLRKGDKQGEPHGRFEVPGVLAFTFQIVCAWRDLDAQELIARRDVPLLPLVPFAAGTSKDRVEEALRLLAHEPTPRRVELQAALVTFADRVFPEVSWADKIPKEILMGSTIFSRGEAKGRADKAADLIAKLLRHRLGEGADVEALVKRLPLCGEATLDRISFLVVDVKKEDLLAAVNDLMSKDGKAQQFA